MTKALMVDCESLDTSPTAALLSVGIVEMDLDKLTLGKELYLRVDADDCLKHGMTVSADTLRFWSEQDPTFFRAAFKRKKAGEHFNDDNDYWNPLAFAIPKISNFVEPFGEVDLWACGSRDFDWLETAYKALGTAVPWKYNRVRDYRTMREQFVKVAMPPDNGQAHHALGDAKWQAEHLLSIFKYLRGMPQSDLLSKEEEL